MFKVNSRRLAIELQSTDVKEQDVSIPTPEAISVHPYGVYHPTLSKDICLFTSQKRLPQPLGKHNQTYQSYYDNSAYKPAASTIPLGPH